MFRICVAITSVTLLLMPLCAATPQEALSRMKIPDGFEISLVAHEPEIRQPVAMQFDARGRLWVLQYLQYPTPAGLTSVKVDQYLRTTYDRIPEAPPKGPQGADKLTICEDTDGDGKADRFLDFVTGLNLASGFALGHGGVFVVQPPYLLFYADKNQDDRPDGHPKVLLKGFGMEDAHAFANSLQWGPDGWLYGAQGSTVTADIRGIRFQQGIWRYHPQTKAFELFSEGGGNTWGLDFDSIGNLIAGTNYGEEALLHHVPGSYHVKNFGKHGELQNPYAFGFFGHVPYKNFKGGHVTCGGILYHGGSLPDFLKGKYIAANPLSHAVYWHHIERNGSTFKARHGGELIETEDPEFRPIDCLTGPDGALYVADWTDKRLTHVDPKDNWDRSNGRIYRLQAKGSPSARSINFTRWSVTRLLKGLADTNQWVQRVSRQLLAEKQNPPRTQLEDLVRTNSTSALDAFWTLYTGGLLNDAFVLEQLLHKQESIRAWAIRAVGDRDSPSTETLGALVRLAREDSRPPIQSELLTTARRLPANRGLPILHEVMSHAANATDPYLPLLAWWTVDQWMRQDRHAVLKYFETNHHWTSLIVQTRIIPNLVRRFLSETGAEGESAVITLLKFAPNPTLQNLVLQSMDVALLAPRKQSGELHSTLSKLLEKQTDPVVIRVAAKLGVPAAIEKIRIVLKPGMEGASRWLEALTVSGMGKVDDFAYFYTQSATREAALKGLSSLQDDGVGELLLSSYVGSPPGPPRARIRSVLLSRPTWADMTLKAVTQQRIKPEEFTSAEIRQLRTYNKPEMNSQILKIWGGVDVASRDDLEKRFNQIWLLIEPRGATEPSKGHVENGRALFQKACASCHSLFGEGAKVGPDLTSAERKNKESLVKHIVNPSAYIRAEYLVHTVETQDAQSFSGLVRSSDATAVVLVDASLQETRVDRASVAKITPSEVSMMPEGLLDQFSEQEIVDLFTYLQRD